MADTGIYKQHLADIAEQDEAGRRDQYQRAWLAYDGEQVDPDEHEINLDYAALIVDKGVSFLAGAGVTLTLTSPSAESDDPDDPGYDSEDDTGSGGPSALEIAAAMEEARVAEAEAAACAAWPLMELDFHNLATNGGVCGHAWLRLREDATVQILDPGNVTVVWNEDDFTIVERYLIEWNSVDEATGLGVLRRKRIEPDVPEKPTSWTTFDEEDDNQGNWLILDETVWSHDYAPVLGCQNLPAPNTFYGRSDLECAILDQIDQLQSIASDMRAVVDLHGHPVPVIIGADATDLRTIDVSIGELLAIPNPLAKLDQLVAAELTSSLALYAELKTALFESARIPKVALGDTENAGPTAAVALKVEYAPLIEKTGTKYLTYGWLLCETRRRQLDLLSFPGWIVNVAFGDPLPDDPIADASQDETELRMGIVSKQTIAEKRGYDWDVEQQRIHAEREAGQAAFDAGLGGSNLYGGTSSPPPPPALGGGDA